MIRILVLQTLPRPDVFSPRNALLTLARHLDRTRFVMTVAVPAKGRLTEALEAESVDTVTITGLRTYRRHDAIWRSPAVAVRIVRLIARRGVDLLVSNHAELGPFADAAARWRGLPWICFLRQAGRPDTYYEKYKVARAHAVAAVSDAALTDLRTHLHRNHRTPGLLSVIRTGIEMPPEMDREPVSKPPDLGAVGLRSVKRPDLLLEIFARIRPEIPRARCLMVGSTDEAAMENLRSLSATLGVADAVELPGQQQDMGSWYRRMAVYAHTSRSEALPKSVLEAMSYGLPVVAFDVGGNREVVAHGETGLLCAEGDCETFGKNLKQLLLDTELAARMGRAGRARVERDFSAATMAREMMSLFERVAANRVGAGASIAPRTA